MTWLHVVLDLPADRADAGIAFWSRALGWPAGDPWQGHPELRSFRPPSGDPYVHAQVTGDPAPRVHVDVDVADVEASTAALVGLGARRIVRDTGSSTGWVPMLSPGGLPFCLVPAADRDAPAPVTWPHPDGGVHRSRLVQVSLDCPGSLVAAEVDFWRRAVRIAADASDGSAAPDRPDDQGWWWRPGTDEFVGKLFPPPGRPVQLLFHRLGDDDTGTVVRAHLDLGTDDVAAEAGRLEQLGARRLWPGGGFVALRDPAGLPFCATHNPPDVRAVDGRATPRPVG